MRARLVFYLLDGPERGTVTARHTVTAPDLSAVRSWCAGRCLVLARDLHRRVTFTVHPVRRF